MTKVTKKARKEFLRKKLGEDPRWALKGLLLVLNRQTEDEQESEMTHYHNTIGFSGIDGQIMTSIGNSYRRYKSLSEKQMKIVFKYMPRYWRQILEETNLEKLDNIIRGEVAPL